jgi:hypothetical protein
MNITHSLVRIGAAVCSLVVALCVSVAIDAQTKQVDLSFDSGRPVGDAIRALFKQHPIVITYEDPRYEYQADIKDATAIARSPENLRRPGAVLVPRGGPLAISYEISIETENPVDLGSTLQKVVDAQYASQSGGRFHVLQLGNVFHVVPAEVRNSKGVWTTQSSILDTRITLPNKELAGDDMLRAITNAVSEATGIYVGLGTLSMNLFHNYTGYLEASDEPARDVLIRVLHSINHRLTWRLLYGPDVKKYAMNITLVAERKTDIPHPALPLETGLSPVGRAPTPEN